MSWRINGYSSITSVDFNVTFAFPFFAFYTLSHFIHVHFRTFAFYNFPHCPYCFSISTKAAYNSCSGLLLTHLSVLLREQQNAGNIFFSIKTNKYHQKRGSWRLDNAHGLLPNSYCGGRGVGWLSIILTLTLTLSPSPTVTHKNKVSRSY